MKERKKYSKEEKLRIVQEAAEQGVKATLHKYGTQWTPCADQTRHCSKLV
jgi:transposase-like protein